MSLCDKCYLPGYCCRKMPLNIHFWDNWPVQEQFDKMIVGTENATATFTVLEKQPGTTIVESNGEPRSRYYFSCPHLMSNGRCGQYEQRPQLCRIYEPGIDGLCVHYLGAEGTGEGL